MKNPNCYTCIYRKDLIWSAHSECKHPLWYYELATNFKFLGIKLNPHGVKCGWADWPFDFDPVWLDSCNGFKKLTKKEKTNG